MIADFEALRGLAAEWDALAAGLSPRLPFATPAWGLGWWLAYCRNGFAARDELHSYVLRDACGALVAVAPMFVTHRPGFGPFRARELQFFGADPNVTEWRGLICRPELAVAALAVLSQHIVAEKPADFVQWRGAPSAAAQAALGEGFVRRPEMDLSVFYLDLPESWDALRATLSRNIKESLRKCYNSLERDGHDFTLRVVEAADEAPAALDIFFTLHSARADARETIRHADVFGGEVSRDFLRAYCDDMARRGDLRIFQLVIGGKVVASRIGFRFGDELYMYFSGYDLEWSRYSVMTTLVAEAIKWAIGQKVRLFNLSTGRDVSKTRWRPQSRDYAGGFVVLGGPSSRLALAAIEALRGRQNPRGDAAAAGKTLGEAEIEVNMPA
jgi:CelD/BcsL family acetyltransferase involved in cellulose biosynthesis